MIRSDRKDWRDFVLAIALYTLSAASFIWLCNAIAVWEFGIKR